MYADALVAIFRFLPLDISIPLFQTCVEPERSDAIKTCLVRATLTIYQDQRRFKWQRSFERVAEAVAPRLRDLLKV